MSRKAGSSWAFRMMAIIHDNPLRPIITDPYKVLKAAELKSGQTVLEIGCGPGFFTVPAAKIVEETGTVYALDIQPLAMKRVEKKISKEGIANVKTVLADATDTGLSDQSIDLAFLFGLPRLLRNESLFNSLLTELYRVLRPDGIISIKGRKKQKIVEMAERKEFIHLKDADSIIILVKK